MTHKPWTAGVLSAAALTLLLAAPSGASAAKVVNAKAVINSCGGEQLAMVARAKPKKRIQGRGARRRLRKFRRKIRGARLEVQFNAVALFGGAQRSPWMKADRGGRASYPFSGLPADNWSGFVRFRWRKGARTRGSSFVNTSNGRVAGRKGRSLCSLGVGVLPRDTVAPFAAIFPDDSAWRRPFNARIFSRDDFSGVAATEYKVDGGSLRQGSDVALGGQGTHRVEYRARDAAGNASAFRRASLRVDAKAPTPPVVDPAPFNPSGNAAPTIRWNRSTDSGGSGVKRYQVVVSNPDGSVAASRSVRSTGASRQGLTLPTLHSGFKQVVYTVRVYAFDGVEFRSVSAGRTFNIDTRLVARNSFSNGCDPPDVTQTGPSTGFRCDLDSSTSPFFPGNELRSYGVTRSPCNFLSCNPRTWTATVNVPIPTDQANQRFAVSFARYANLLGGDSATITAQFAGGAPKTLFSGRSVAAGRSAFISQGLPAGGSSVAVTVALTLAAEGSNPQPINPSLLLDEIAVSRVD